MSTIEVKVRSPTKKRVGGGDGPSGRRGKRQQLATAPTRLTRSRLKKLNENNGPPVTLDPGLEMGARRGGKRERFPKEAVQDRTSTVGAEGTSQVHESSPESGPAKKAKKDNRVSSADVAAASRLAQAAMAAGLTRKDPEASTPTSAGLERPAGLVRFTKDDLKEVFREVVGELDIRQNVEPHWLARTEFLTWWSRPVANIDPIKEDVRRLVLRWGKDLKTQSNDDTEVPLWMLDTWTADNVLVADMDMETEVTRKVLREGTYGDGDEDIRSLRGALALAKQELTNRKHSFDGKMSPDRRFGSKRFWGAMLSEIQQDAAIFEKKIRQLNVFNLDNVAASTRQAADSLLAEVQEWRAQLQEDNDALKHEVDREEEADRIQKADDFLRAAEDTHVAAPPNETQEMEADKVGIQGPEVEEDHGSSTGDIVLSGVEPGLVEQSSEETGQVENSKSSSAHASGKEASQGTPSPVRSDESALPTPTHINDAESDHGLSKLRDASQIDLGRGSSAPSDKEDEFEAEPAAEHKESDREDDAPKTEEDSESQIATPEQSPGSTPERIQEATPEENTEATPWLPDKIGSHDPAWEWPRREQEDPGAAAPVVAVAADAAAVAAEEEEAKEPSPEGEPDTGSGMSDIQPGTSAGEEAETEDPADHARPPTDKADLSQDSKVRDSLDASEVVITRESLGVYPNVRYIKPQWEMIDASPPPRDSSPNDYSANEFDDEDDGEEDEKEDEEQVEDRDDLFDP
ncbi:hypothetical protein diail_1745 [Diaporthe ilicicola]|nr:hypothetical protein diail_1745 [Diaporthe ilicicola]